MELNRFRIKSVKLYKWHISRTAVMKPTPQTSENSNIMTEGVNLQHLHVDGYGTGNLQR